MSVLLPLTLHLSIALGLYAFAGSLGILLMAADRRDRLMEEMAGSPGLLFGYGALAFAIGAAWIMAHHEWITPLGVVISLAGWIFAIEGLGLLAFPGVFLRAAIALRPLLTPLCLIGMIAGPFLVFLGLTGTANALPDAMLTPA